MKEKERNRETKKQRNKETKKQREKKKEKERSEETKNIQEPSETPNYIHFNHHRTSFIPLPVS